jgi:uncharacterized membrane protein YsdA (DUF1294 family)/cold shock CspA family protein
MAKPPQTKPSSTAKPAPASTAPAPKPASAPPNKVPATQSPKPPPSAQEKLPSGVQHGFVVMVNPKEGYGFIRPGDAAREENRDVHFGLRQVEGHKHVRAGQSVSYYLTRTEKGVTAINVHPGSVFSIPYLKFLLVGVVSALLLLAGLVIVLKEPASLPVWIGLWVISFSIATYGVYAYDKAQAQSQGLRVPEAVLHLLEALGGSPGAFVAMRVLHHKNKKREYQVVFWLIVAAQAGFLIWLFLLR